MKLARQIIHGVALNHMVTIIEMGVGFLQQVLLVRYFLGLAQYGTLAFFQAGFGILAMFFNMNLNYSAIRFGGAAQGKEDAEEFFRIQGTTLFLTVLLHGAMLGVSYLLMWWGFEYKEKVVGEYYVLLALNALAAVPAGFVATLFTSRKEFKDLSIQQILSTLVGAFSVLLFCAIDHTVKGAIHGMIAGSIVASLISMGMAWRDLIRCRLDLSLTKAFGIYGGQFALSSVIKQIFWKADILILGLYWNERAVGLYRIVQTVANPLMRAFSPLWTVLFPTVSVESGKGNMENIRKLLFRGTQWLVVGNLPIVIAGAFAVDFFVPRIYGVAHAAVFPIRLLLWGYALGTMTSVAPPILRVFRNDLALTTTFAAAVLNVTLNLILIPQFGINGAAMAGFISFGLLAIAVYYCAFYAMKIPVLPLLNGEVMLQLLWIALIMVASIGNHFWVAAGLFLGLLLFLFRFRIVSLAEFRAYLAS